MLINKFNYKKHIDSDIHYYHRVSNNNTKDAIFFIHGAGIGPLPYIEFLLSLPKDKEIFILIIPNISNYIFSNKRFEKKIYVDFFINSSVLLSNSHDAKLVWCISIELTTDTVNSFVFCIFNKVSLGKPVLPLRVGEKPMMGGFAPNPLKNEKGARL